MPFNISCQTCGCNEGSHYDPVFAEDACGEYSPNIEEAKLLFADFVKSFDPNNSTDYDDYEIYQQYFGFTSKTIEQKIIDTPINYKMDLGQLLSDMDYKP